MAMRRESEWTVRPELYSLRLAGLRDTLLACTAIRLFGVRSRTSDYLLFYLKTVNANILWSFEMNDDIMAVCRANFNSASISSLVIIIIYNTGYLLTLV